MIEYAKCFDSNKTMSFKVTDKKLFKKYTKIWEKVSSLMKKEFDIESVYGDNDKYKDKIKDISGPATPGEGAEGHAPPTPTPTLPSLPPPHTYTHTHTHTHFFA